MLMEQVFPSTTPFDVNRDKLRLDFSRITGEPSPLLSPITPGKQLARRHAELLVEGNSSSSEYKRLPLEVHHQLEQQDLTFTEKLDYWQKYCRIVEAELDKVRQTPRETKPASSLINALESTINCYAEAAWQFILDKSHKGEKRIELLSKAFTVFGNIARRKLAATDQHLFQWKNQGKKELCPLFIACVGEKITDEACLQRLAALLDARDQWQAKQDLVKLVESQPSELREAYLNRRLSQEICQENWNNVKFALLFKPPQQSGWLDWPPSGDTPTVTPTLLRRITALMKLLDPAKESAALCRLVDQIFPKLHFLSTTEIDTTEVTAAIDALIEAFDHRLTRVQEDVQLGPAVWRGYQTLLAFVARKTEGPDQLDAACFLSYDKLLLIGAEMAPLGIETVSDWQLRHRLICTAVNADILMPDDAEIHLERLMQHVFYLLGQTPKLSEKQANQWEKALQIASELEANAGLDPSEQARLVIDCWIATPFLHTRRACLKKIRPGLQLLLSPDCPESWRDRCLGQIGPLVFLRLAYHTDFDAETFQKETDLMLELLVNDCVLEDDLETLSEYYLEQSNNLSTQELERAFRVVTALPYVHRNFSDRCYGWFTPELHYDLLTNLNAAMSNKKTVFGSDVRGQLLGHLCFYHCQRPEQITCPAPTSEHSPSDPDPSLRIVKSVTTPALWKKIKTKNHKRIVALTSEPIWELPQNSSENLIVCTAVATYWLLELQTGIFGARHREMMTDSKGATRSTPRGPMQKSDSTRLRRSMHKSPANSPKIPYDLASRAPLQDFQDSDSDIAWGILTDCSETGLPTSPSYKLNWLQSQAVVKEAFSNYNDLARIINSLRCFIGKLCALAISQTCQQQENEIALRQGWHYFMQLVWMSDSQCQTIDPLGTDQADLHGHLLDAFSRLPAKILKQDNRYIWLLCLVSRSAANKSQIIKSHFFKNSAKSLLIRLHQLSTEENEKHQIWRKRTKHCLNPRPKRDAFKIGKEIFPLTMLNLRHCLDDAEWAEVLRYPKRKAREQIMTEAKRLGLVTTQDWTTLSHCLKCQAQKEVRKQLERFSLFTEEEWLRFRNSPPLKARKHKPTKQRDGQLTDGDWKEIIEFLKHQARKWVLVEVRPYQLVDHDEIIGLFQQQAQKSGIG
jgi:hypothetical protein